MKYTVEKIVAELKEKGLNFSCSKAGGGFSYCVTDEKGYTVGGGWKRQLAWFFNTQTGEVRDLLWVSKTVSSF